MKPYCVPEKTEKYTGYDMIRNHTEIPALPDARLRLLHAFLEASDSADKTEVYGMVTGLLQIGLDIHDRVAPGDDSEEEQAMRSRQLKVLAGDYYSSRFYQLLAAAGEVDMVAELSRAIADVNRRKMELYLRMQGTSAPELREYVEEAAAIKARLFVGFDVSLSGPLLPDWQSLLKLVALCEAAVEELEAATHGEALHYGLHPVGEAEAAELKQLLLGFADRLEASIAALPAQVNREVLGALADGFRGAAETKGKVNR